MVLGYVWIEVNLMATPILRSQLLNWSGRIWGTRNSRFLIWSHVKNIIDGVLWLSEPHKKSLKKNIRDRYKIIYILKLLFMKFMKLWFGVFNDQPLSHMTWMKISFFFNLVKVGRHFEKNTQFWLVKFFYFKFSRNLIDGCRSLMRLLCFP